MPNEKDADTPAADPERQPPPQSPMIPAAPQEDKVGENSNSRSDEENNKTRKLEEDIRSGERWLIGVSAAAVILNAIIALIYYGQLKEMRKATRASVKAANAAASAADIADKTLKEVRAGSTDTHALAEAAKAQAGSATKFAASAEGIKSETANAVGQLKRSAKDSEDAIKQAAQNAQNALNLSVNITNLEQRPWMGHYADRITQFDKKAVKAKFVFFNSGKTPALGILGYAKLFVFPGDFGQCVVNPPAERMGAVAPQNVLVFTEEHVFDETGKVPFDTFAKVTDTTIPEDQVAYLYACGSIIYWDIRGMGDDANGNAIQPHSTTFCFVYDRKSREFGICDHGNNMN